MAEPPNPRVSVIIPVYNSLELTQACVESVLNHQSAAIPLEIILIDDLSTDGAREFVASLEGRNGFRVLLRSTKGNFSINNNQAAKIARAPYLCLLNNDTQVTAGWLEPMLALMEDRPNAGLIGNIQVSPATGLIDHAGMVCWPDGFVRQARKNRRLRPSESWLEWTSVTAACVFVRREVFLAAGGFDEEYRNGCEDVDLALRLHRAGYRHYVVNESVIYHHVSAAPGRQGHTTDNERRFQAKWGTWVAEQSHHEWPSEYFHRYARHWWKLRPDRVLIALAWRLRYGSWYRERGPRPAGVDRRVAPGKPFDPAVRIA